MNIEEKAKRYDDIIEKANKMHHENCEACQMCIEELIPELRESKEERMIKSMTRLVKAFYDCNFPTPEGFERKDMLAWLEKQGETFTKKDVDDAYLKGVCDTKHELEKQCQQKPTETEPFEAEHGKYYYCIKDYFCSGRKQASKGDVVQALRGLPIMGLKDASEYFLPVNFIKCNSTWSEEDKEMIGNIRTIIQKYAFSQSAVDVNGDLCEKEYIDADNWLKSLRPQNTWKPSEYQLKSLQAAIDIIGEQTLTGTDLKELLEQLNKLKR